MKYRDLLALHLPLVEEENGEKFVAGGHGIKYEDNKLQYKDSDGTWHPIEIEGLRTDFLNHLEELVASEKGVHGLKYDKLNKRLQYEVDGDWFTIPLLDSNEEETALGVRIDLEEHVAKDVESNDGVHGIKYNADEQKLQYKKQGEWQSMPFAIGSVSTDDLKSQLDEHTESIISNGGSHGLKFNKESNIFQYYDNEQWNDIVEDTTEIDNIKLSIENNKSQIQILENKFPSIENDIANHTAELAKINENVFINTGNIKSIQNAVKDNTTKIDATNDIISDNETKIAELNESLGELQITLENHKKETVASENGSHGLRYDRRLSKLQYKDNDDLWSDIFISSNGASADSVNVDLQNHKNTSVLSSDGVHGLKYNKNKKKLQYYEGNTWNDIAGDSVNVDELTTAIQENKTQIGLLNNKIPSIESNIATNTSNIVETNENVYRNTGDINSLKDKVGAHTSQLTALQGAVDANSNKTQELASSIQESNSKIQELDRSVEASKEQIDSINNGVTANAAEIEKLKPLIQSNTTQIESLDGNIKNNSTQIQSLNESVSQNTNAIKSANNNIQTNAQQIEFLNQAAEDIQTALEAHSEEQIPSNNGVHGFRYNKDSMKLQYKDNNVWNDVPMDSSDNSAETVGAALQVHTNKNIASEEGVHGLRFDKSENIFKYYEGERWNPITPDTSALDTLNKTVEQHTTQIEDINSSIQQQSNKIIEMGETVEQNTDQITTLKQSVEDNKTQVESLKGSVQGNTEQIATINSSVEGVQSTVQTHTTSKVVSDAGVHGFKYDKQNKKFQYYEDDSWKDIVSDTTNIDELTETVQGHTAQLSNINDAISQNTSKIEGLDSTTKNHAAQIGALSGRVDGNQTEISNIKESLQSNITNTQQIQSELQTHSNAQIASSDGVHGFKYNKETNKFQYYETSRWNDINPDTSKLDSLEGIVAGHTSQISDIDEKVGTNSEQLESLNQTVARNTSKIDELTQSVSNNSTQISAIDDEVEINKSDIVSIKSSIQDLQGSVSINTQNIDTMNDTLAGQTSQIGVLEENVNANKSSIGTLNESLETAKQAFAEHENKKVIDGDGVHGLKYDVNTNALQYKDATDNWQTIPTGGGGTGEGSSEALNSHIEQKVSDPNGVHGIRYLEEEHALEITTQTGTTTFSPSIDPDAMLEEFILDLNNMLAKVGNSNA